MQASLISLPAKRWLIGRPKAQVLHVFDRSVNVLAEDGEILSLATAEIEPGPFLIVVKCETDPGCARERYFDGVDPATTVVADASGLQVGRLNVRVDRAECWDPRLDVSLLNKQPVRGGLNLIRSLMVPSACNESLWLALHSGHGSLFQRRIRQGWHKLRQGILSEDPRLCAEGARLTAGVGIGLTPAGDDFLVGALIGLWSGLADPERYVGSIVAGATPHTNKLSAAWITAAGRGEVGQVWHDLALALLDRDQSSILCAGRSVLGVGHTSGSDAMSGFVATLELISRSWRSS